MVKLKYGKYTIVNGMRLRITTHDPVACDPLDDHLLEFFKTEIEIILGSEDQNLFPNIPTKSSAELLDSPIFSEKNRR